MPNRLRVINHRKRLGLRIAGGFGYWVLVGDKVDTAGLLNKLENVVRTSYIEAHILLDRHRLRPIEANFDALKFDVSTR